MDTRLLQAAIRFGLGPRPDQPLPSDPLAWLDAQLAGDDIAPPPPEGFEKAPDVAEGYRIWREHSEASRAMRAPRDAVLALYRAEAASALGWRIDTPAPFRERLVDFWSNHFTVSRRAGHAVASVQGAYVREAIRPHVTGRFADMLVAVIKHPAMLSYLDQASSIGPNSPAGRKRGRGLNENLARELLELHTLSPAAGYTQADVVQCARLLTGWGIERSKEPVGAVFRPANHEPGPKTVLGRQFEEGPEAAEALLRFLADHPATQQHLATKLVRHFVADDPPPEAVSRIAAVLRDTGGDLRAVAMALPRLPGAWEPPLGKLRSPVDLVTATFRAGGASGADAGTAAYSACALLNQPFWAAPQPNGWPDEASGWLGPEAAMQRLDWIYDAAGRLGRLDPGQVLEASLGPLAPQETHDAVRRAGSMREALALIFASPEFQRR
ncbi:DUF1800 domain-containing protein [Roseomonas sp. M0104]|uniref:DUF1800 domain-containing protein n=1 Tax=Teichococcus coralli TaxID=2545983 RepID=A0A845BHY0_9PROT|nr:DUF1800 domain-containing protein [Pseudoroseomonas coralli]MXP64907.1 DUF1800 domain-containing protein [Pseudoroseomonas coralli]